VCGDDGADRVWATPDRAFAVPGLYTVVRCRRCGFLYQRPRVRDEHLAACYPDHYPRHQEPSPRMPLKGSKRRQRAARWALASGLGYEAFREARVSLLTRLRAPRMLRRIRWSCPPWTGAGRYLDVGCGSGGSLAQPPMRRSGEKPGVERLSASERARIRRSSAGPAAAIS
jgi:hypothetical protein